MAQLIGNIPWLGSLGTLTAYKRRGSDKIILRTRKGPLSESVKKGDKFELTRLNNAEFGGRSRASSSIMTAMINLKSLADYNVAGSINAILKPIQVADPVNEKGKRSILLSSQANLLQGFNFNRNHTFDSVVRTQVLYTFDKETLSAKVVIPELIRGINLFIPNKHPLFGFTINLGVIPDFIFKGDEYRAVNNEHHRDVSRVVLNTEWFPCVKGSKPLELELQLRKTDLPSSYTIILGIGIQYATLGQDAVIETVKYEKVAKGKYDGSAKIIGTLGVY